MAKSKFEPKNKYLELEIMGKVFNVDAGNEDIPILFAEAAEEVEKVKSETRAADYVDTRAYMEATTEKIKVVYEETINNVLGDGLASKTIFSENNAMSFYDEVYMFIADEITKAVDFAPSYAPTREN